MEKKKQLKVKQISVQFTCGDELHSMANTMTLIYYPEKPVASRFFDLTRDLTIEQIKEIGELFGLVSEAGEKIRGIVDGLMKDI